LTFPDFQVFGLNEFIFRGDEMEIHVFKAKADAGCAAADHAALIIRESIRDNNRANIILATGASQFEMLENLVSFNLDWHKVHAFHLDEYIGIPSSHPASFRKYLKDRFVSKLPNLGEFHYINAEDGDPAAECQRLNGIIGSCRIDLACIGIGENGHIAFNDPPADFKTEEPYIVVKLDEACRKQQVGEGWYHTLDEVPTHAISMSVRQIMKSGCIVCTVPDLRKAKALRDALEGPVTNLVPASVLQEHPDCRIFADEPATSLLSGNK
jgi:glucosamine-6-phosphate deaminase